MRTGALALAIANACLFAHGCATSRPAEKPAEKPAPKPTAGPDVARPAARTVDDVLEELFVLAARVGIDQVQTIVAPVDLRRRPPPDLGERALAWVPMLYAQIASALAEFR